MMKNKTKKRKFATSEASASEKNSSQGSLTNLEGDQSQPKYIPRFGSALKRAKLEICQLQEDICTQPVADSNISIVTDETISATQPVTCQRALKESSSELSDAPHDIPIPSVSHGIALGLSLTQAESNSQTHTSPDPSIATDQEPLNKETSLPRSPQMNLDLLNPFSTEDIERNSIAENLSNRESASVLEINEPLKGPLIDIEVEPSCTEGQPLQIAQPQDDATLPTGQDLPNVSANTESLYDNTQEDKTMIKNNKALSKMRVIHTETDTCVDNTDKEKVMVETLGLRAEDLMESQFVFQSPPDNAVVPTSPAKQMVKQGDTASHRAGYVFNQATESIHITEDGSLRGIIQELSSINQHILRYKRELEHVRKQKEAWLRTRQIPHHR